MGREGAGTDFWSRRRAAVAAQEAAEQEAAQAAALAEAEAERAVAQEQKTDEELLEELKLPDPDSLQMGDDFSVFMQSAVPERLRRRALRRLWRSNPVLANLDGLVDFGEDFSDAAMVVPDMKTTYQVGRGLLRHVEELAAQAEREAQADTVARDAPEGAAKEPAAADADDIPAGEADTVTAAGHAEEWGSVPPESATAYSETVPEEPAAAERPRRRMRFAFRPEPSEGSTE
ncbi:DUF3306 domain-containing protein [Alkalilacustris brevis]|uniref:DUF3306 domain-containing protein n=1 Tax=Alkalilacustris brevis TaxID=2026338 RepID=UPI000E0DEE36|nr:DUF3306 domain-containing protein [Alkalilacustris brevis]